MNLPHTTIPRKSHGTLLELSSAVWGCPSQRASDVRDEDHALLGEPCSSDFAVRIYYMWNNTSELPSSSFDIEKGSASGMYLSRSLPKQKACYKPSFNLRSTSRLSAVYNANAFPTSWKHRTRLWGANYYWPYQIPRMDWRFMGEQRRSLNLFL